MFQLFPTSFMNTYISAPIIAISDMIHNDLDTFLVNTFLHKVAIPYPDIIILK